VQLASVFHSVHEHDTNVTYIRVRGTSLNQRVEWLEKVVRVVAGKEVSRREALLARGSTFVVVQYGSGGIGGAILAIGTARENHRSG
jgi:hypothetical protein